MTDEKAPLEAADPPGDAGARVPIPIGIRILGMIAFTLVLIAIFAFVRSRPEADDRDALGAPVGSFDPPEIGVVAPDFSVPTMSGGTFTLSEHLISDGRPVLLNFWGSWCFPCTREMPDIEEASLRHPEIFFIGVAIREPEAPARNFAEGIGITYEIGFDVNGRVESSWDIWPMPETYLIAPDGKITGRVFGPLNAESFDSLLATAISTPGS